MDFKRTKVGLKEVGEMSKILPGVFLLFVSVGLGTTEAGQFAETVANVEGRTGLWFETAYMNENPAGRPARIPYASVKNHVGSCGWEQGPYIINTQQGLYQVMPEQKTLWVRQDGYDAYVKASRGNSNAEPNVIRILEFWPGRAIYVILPLPGGELNDLGGGRRYRISEEGGAIKGYGPSRRRAGQPECDSSHPQSCRVVFDDFIGYDVRIEKGLELKGVRMDCEAGREQLTLSFAANAGLASASGISMFEIVLLQPGNPARSLSDID